LTQSAPFFPPTFPDAADLRGLRPDSLGGLGVDEVKWLAPLRPGDEITLQVHVDEARLSKSQPDARIVKVRAEMFNAAGTLLMTIVNNGVMRHGASDSEAGM
jgi:acyl dehydratase